MDKDISPESAELRANVQAGREQADRGELIPEYEVFERLAARARQIEEAAGERDSRWGREGSSLFPLASATGCGLMLGGVSIDRLLVLERIGNCR